MSLIVLYFGTRYDVCECNILQHMTIDLWPSPVTFIVRQGHFQFCNYMDVTLLCIGSKCEVCRFNRIWDIDLPSFLRVPWSCDQSVGRSLRSAADSQPFPTASLWAPQVRSKLPVSDLYKLDSFSKSVLQFECQFRMYIHWYVKSSVYKDDWVVDNVLFWGGIWWPVQLGLIFQYHHIIIWFRDYNY